MRRPVRQRDVASPTLLPRELLAQGRAGGYPVEYLLSRVRGRRSRLIRDWKPLIYGAPPAEYLASPQYQGFVRERSLEGLWQSLQQEHQWIFSQLDETMRRMLAPYFLYTELRTITSCLRMLQGEKTQETAAVLAGSLLCDRLKGALSGGDVADAVASVEEHFCGISAAFRGMREAYEARGMRELEQMLVGRYLEAVLGQPLHPVLRQLFVRIIDARNILSLYKSHRLASRDASVFLGGGTIPVERLQDLRERDDLFTAVGLIRQATGITIAEPEPTQVEVALYRGITRFLKQEGRDPLGVGLIVDYLWRCSLEVTNLSVLFAGKDLEREAMAAEVVQ